MNNYEKIKIVGRGAFGTVFLCRQLNDNKEVIVKQIPIEQLSKIDRQSTLNEVKVLSMLHHPNIIEYYSNFLQDQAMMIVMEYAAGGTLFEYIEEKASEEIFFEEAEIAHLFAQIVLPIHLVHSRQILHRDLKSQNIFLTRNRDHVKIGDFGISKILASKSKAFTVIGTPCYISPELCEGKPYNQKSDIWAMGCILYEMCALKRAFEAPTLPALVLKIMRGNFHPIPSHYSPNLKQFVANILSVDPNSRPSLAELMSDPWLAPPLYRLPTTLGALPCTAKPPRPLTVRRRTDQDEELEDFSVWNVRRSVSPFSQKPRKVFEIKCFDRNGKQFQLQLPKSCLDDPIINVAVHSSRLIFGITTEGRVLMWNCDQGHEKLDTKSARLVEGLSGIVIKKIVVDSEIACLITDRGILMTMSLTSSNSKPKIVEGLLGDEVIKVTSANNLVAALTSDNEVFVWIENESEPKKIDLPNELLEDKISILDIDSSENFMILRTNDGNVWKFKATESGFNQPELIKTDIKIAKLVLSNYLFAINDVKEEIYDLKTKDKVNMTFEQGIVKTDSGITTFIAISNQDKVYKVFIENNEFQMEKVKLKESDDLAPKVEAVSVARKNAFFAILYVS